MRKAEVMQDDEDTRSIDVGPQDQAHWAGNRQRCPTWRNGNISFDTSVSISRRGATDKEASRRAYSTRDKNNGNIVSTKLSGAGL